MGDLREPTRAQSSSETPAFDASSLPPTQQSEGVAFMNQFDSTRQAGFADAQQGAYNMSAMAGFLPALNSLPANPHHPQHSTRDAQAGFNYGPNFQLPRYSMQTNMQMVDPTAYHRAQHQQHFMPVSFVPQSNYRPLPMYNQVQPSCMLPYGYTMGSPQYPPVGSRSGSQFTPTTYSMPGATSPDLAFRTRQADLVPIPSYPRGPPRKPKQSGHALWVGNLPPTAKILDLKDHFSRDALEEIESVFLISKSNCAFVNYRTETACVAAMHRFHDSRFGGVRLVCRLRRGSTSTATPGELPKPSDSASTSPDKAHTDMFLEPDTPTIVGLAPPSPQVDGVKSSDTPAHEPNFTGTVQDVYFIVKSLTQQDLEASVINGVWATQSHNETTLNAAYEHAENVYLVFSANKSGEYFGYARMVSCITGEPTRLRRNGGPDASESPEQRAFAVQSQQHSDGPKSIITPATATAPTGRIIDDSARGTIFWEADTPGGVDGVEETVDGAGGGQDEEWGREFKIEWLSTSRLPFYRTRGLRNPWNSNREVKIARDGTRLEPSVGQRLVSMFH